jgi:hypothetical protein
MWGANGKAIGMRLPTCIGPHVMQPQCISDSIHGATGFNICLPRFHLASVLFPLSMSPFLLLEWECLHCFVFCFVLQELIAKSCLESQIAKEILNSVGTVKTMGPLGDGLNAFAL